jgi:hypothetical protein
VCESTVGSNPTLSATHLILGSSVACRRSCSRSRVVVRGEVA